ncbi:MAG TPA: right-handed parallel beta-helix repeat-containing protein [Oscillospiraceae bacterium]|nr:right-handed parallel beta-helix repeat-containing protein [Oscillospiraceae bacterium]HPF54993.1 right-handed parallel beta-helix repeat-containing protein [Clostridiales bacterium]HPK35939.1 right-handed parallel beta-helix repeat-containing protein [Oscillospiraceae bacterium]HPR75633.1 right-handed parallel beta-helix repeat-containing protein [Oscillospiraceae bacterium]
MNCNEICTIYASVDGTVGDDRSVGVHYDGTRFDRPIGNLQKALVIVQELRGAGQLQPVTIKLMGGEYFLPEPLLIKNPIGNLVIEPYDDKPVVLSGGRLITGFQKAKFNGADCFAVYIDDVKTGKWDFTDLWVDGVRAELTRYPEEGYLHKTAAEVESEKLQNGSKWFIAEKGDIKDFKNLSDCIVSFCHYWIDEHSPIESYDKETRKLTLKYRSRFEIHTNFDYYLENVAEAFGKPNQWYLDRPSGMLYYVPRDKKQTPESIVAHAPEATALFELHGMEKDNRSARGFLPVSSVSLRGLTFSFTRGDYIGSTKLHDGQTAVPTASDGQGVAGTKGVINLTYSENITIENCRFVNYGLYGICAEDGCSNLRILNNEFYDGGAGGIKLNGGPVYTDSARVNHNNLISDNRILHCGQRHMAACGILLMNSYGNTITHNEIGDLYYSGISGGWVWGYTPSVTRDNLIAYNHIHDLGYGVLSDMGGVYLLGAQPGTVVRNNLIHDVNDREYGGWGLYTDEGSAGVLMENNVCYNLSDNCCHQHYGAGNTIRNNIFAFAGRNLLRISRFERHLSEIVEGNLFYSAGKPMYSFCYEPSAEQNHITDRTICLRKNLYFDSKAAEPTMLDLPGFRKFDEIKSYDNEEDSIVADPLFADPEHYDFTLEPNSPAFSLGFKPIDVSNVGPRHS